MYFLLKVPFVLLCLQRLMMLKIMHVYIACASIISEQHLVSVSRVCSLVPRLPASGVGSLVLLSLDLAYSFSPHLHNVSVHIPDRGVWEPDPEELGISNVHPLLMVPSRELATTTTATAGDAILTLPTLHFSRIVTFFLPVLAATDKFVHA